MDSLVLFIPAIFGLNWPLTLVSLSTALYLIYQSKRKERKIEFPYRYLLLSLVFPLALIAYALYPHSYWTRNLEDYSVATKEYHQTVIASDNHIYLTVGLLLLLNVLACIIFVFRARKEHRLLTACILILAFQFSGIVAIFALDSALPSGLD